MKTLTRIKVDINTGEFEFRSDLKKEGVLEVVENVIRSHIGAGKDSSEPNRKDEYNISIEWDFSDDSFVIKSDTGNKSLTDGILMGFLSEHKG